MQDAQVFAQLRDITLHTLRLTNDDGDDDELVFSWIQPENSKLVWLIELTCQIQFWSYQTNVNWIHQLSADLPTSSTG